MKKIYFSLLLLSGFTQISVAQLSLTKAFNEPVIGDFTMRHYFDSTTMVPKTTGAGQTWNFMALTSNTLIESSTYTTVASTPSAAIFPAATISENQGGGTYQHYKSTLTTYEVQGIQFPNTVINFSNTAVFATWPVGFGYNMTDPFGGTTTTGTVTSSITGSINVNASGTGTVILPGGTTLTNCLQVVNTVTFSLSQGTYTQSTVQKEYNYYHSSNKFPALRIQYQTTISGTVTTNNFMARVNTSFLTGIPTYEINNNLSVFPIPASEIINVSLTNNPNAEVSLNLMNALGQVVKTENLGNETSIHANINVGDLPKGIYFMNIKTGKEYIVKKVILN